MVSQVEQKVPEFREPILPEILGKEGVGEETPVVKAQEMEKREIHGEIEKPQLEGLEIVKPKVENPITTQIPSDLQP